MNNTRIPAAPAYFAAAAIAFLAMAPVQAGPLLIEDTGAITDPLVLGSINTAITNVESLYSSGNLAGAVTLNVDFTYSPGPTGFLATSGGPFHFYSYGDYASALTEDSRSNPDNTSLATAVANLKYGNTGTMQVTSTQALLLSNYGLPASGPGIGDININSAITNWNFTGTTTSSQYDAVGAIEHELDELLGIGGGGSFIGSGSGDLGATDLYRYAAPFTPSTSSNTYFSIDGGVTNLVFFSLVSSGDLGDFTPPCGPTPGNSGNNQYIQNAFNCTGSDEVYSTLSPEYVAETAIGWDPVSHVTAVPEPPSIALFGGALVGLAAFLRRRGKSERGQALAQ